MSDINKTLNEREENYGSFKGQAYKAQSLKEIMHDSEEWFVLTTSQKEALDMIQHKIARILNGNGNDYADNWHDIAGYATLVERELIDVKERGDKNELD